MARLENLIKRVCFYSRYQITYVLWVTSSFGWAYDAREMMFVARAGMLRRWKRRLDDDNQAAALR